MTSFFSTLVDFVHAHSQYTFFFCWHCRKPFLWSEPLFPAQRSSSASVL